MLTKEETKGVLLAAKLKREKEDRENAHKFVFEEWGDTPTSISSEYLDSNGNITFLPSLVETEKGMRRLMIEGIKGWLKAEFERKFSPVCTIPGSFRLGGPYSL